MTHSRARIAALSIIPLIVVGLAACSSSPTAAPTSGAFSSGLPKYVLKTSTLTANDVKVSGAGYKIKVAFPFPAQAQQLTTRDVTVGTGAAAQPNQTVTFNFYVASALTGEPVESTYGTDRPVTFPLERGSLTQGDIDGMTGMKVGGRRILVYPGSLAYGDSPPPGGLIQPNETLVSVVDLVAVK